MWWYELTDGLSQQQINRLLDKLKEEETLESEKHEHPAALKQEESTSEEKKDNNNEKNVVKYDFMSPKKYTKDQLRIVDNIFDNIERLISLQLSGMLRVSCDGKVLGIEEMEYKDYINSVEETALIGVVDVSSSDKIIDERQFLLQMDRPLSFCIIDRLLGGDGSCVNIKRDYTDIEMSILKNLYNQFMPKFSDVWDNYAIIEHNLASLETNPRMIQSIPQEETVVIVQIELSIKNLVGIMTACIPSDTMNDMLKCFESKFVKSLKKGDLEQQENRRNALMNSIKSSSLVVTGVLGKTQIQLSELLGLQKGDIFLLDSTSRDKKVTVNVEGVPWYKGSMGVYKKNYAVKLSEVLKEENFSERS